MTNKTAGYDHYWNVLQDVKVGDWELHLRQDPNEGRWFIQIQFDAPDNDETVCYTGDGICGPIIEEPKIVRQYCRKWYLSPYMTKSEIVRTAWKAYEAAILHEAQEMFRYRGRAIYNPHINVDALVDAADAKHDGRNTH